MGRWVFFSFIFLEFFWKWGAFSSFFPFIFFGYTYCGLLCRNLFLGVRKKKKRMCREREKFFVLQFVREFVYFSGGLFLFLIGHLPSLFYVHGERDNNWKKTAPWLKLLCIRVCVSLCCAVVRDCFFLMFALKLQSKLHVECIFSDGNQTHLHTQYINCIHNQGKLTRNSHPTNSQKCGKDFSFFFFCLRKETIQFMIIIGGTKREKLTDCVCSKPQG